MNRLKKFVSAALLLSGFLTFTVPLTASAVNKCGDVETSFDFGCKGTNSTGKTIQTTPIYAFLLALMNFLAFGVGIAVVGGIMWGGYNIISSNGNAGKMEEGVNIIMNAVIGLILFIFMYAAVNFLVPGGLFT